MSLKAHNGSHYVQRTNTCVNGNRPTLAPELQFNIQYESARIQNSKRDVSKDHSSSKL